MRCLCCCCCCFCGACLEADDACGGRGRVGLGGASVQRVGAARGRALPARWRGGAARERAREQGCGPESGGGCRAERVEGEMARRRARGHGAECAVRGWMTLLERGPSLGRQGPSRIAAELASLLLRL
eukprot:3134766-Rhodomonas_salina.1